MEQVKWLGLGYNLPANPSKNRVYVWRKIKDLGAVLFRQGIAILPKSRESLTRFLGLSARIRDMGGDASIIEMKFLDQEDEREMVRQFREQSETEYMELLRDCANILDELAKNVFDTVDRVDDLRKMRRRYDKAKARDYFKSSQGPVTEKRLNQLLDQVKRDNGPG